MWTCKELHQKADSWISKRKARTFHRKRSKCEEYGGFLMNKLLSCCFNMDTNRVEARFSDGSTVALDCITAGRNELAALQQALGVRPACAGWRDGALSVTGLRPRQIGRLTNNNARHENSPADAVLLWHRIYRGVALFYTPE